MQIADGCVPRHITCGFTINEGCRFHFVAILAPRNFGVSSISTNRIRLRPQFSWCFVPPSKLALCVHLYPLRVMQKFAPRSSIGDLQGYNVTRPRRKLKAAQRREVNPRRFWLGNSSPAEVEYEKPETIAKAVKPSGTA